MIINGERALAYIVTVDEIKPIEGYDRVEYARTNGWWVVVSKNDNLKVGDKCVYFEVDSKVNSKDERFAFLEKRNYRIKTQRMCKVISQGLLMPITLFPEITDTAINTDVTKLLKVTYYVPEDNDRKSNGDPFAKYESMKARKPNIFKKKWAKWMMKRNWGRKTRYGRYLCPSVGRRWRSLYFSLYSLKSLTPARASRLYLSSISMQRELSTCSACLGVFTIAFLRSSSSLAAIGSTAR